jgi:hypothetical protein
MTDTAKCRLSGIDTLYDGVSLWRSACEVAKACNLSIDLAIDAPRQSACGAHQVPPHMSELRTADARSCVCAEKQERRNNRASERDH